MATHSGSLAWRIPGTAEPGGLLSVASQSQIRLTRLSSSSRLVITEKLMANVINTQFPCNVGAT